MKNNAMMIAHIKNIGNTVARAYGIPPERLQEKTRIEAVRIPRQITWAISKEIYGNRISTPVLGEMFGGKDHATVLHGIKTINNLLDTDRAFRFNYNVLLKRCQNNSRAVREAAPEVIRRQLEDILMFQSSVNIKIALRQVINNLRVA